MSHRSIVIILALLVALMPYLGFPYSFEKYFYLGVGIVIASIVYRSREFRGMRTQEHSPGSRSSEENSTEQNNHTPGV